MTFRLSKIQATEAKSDAARAPAPAWPWAVLSELPVQLGPQVLGRERARQAGGAAGRARVLDGLDGIAAAHRDDRDVARRRRRLETARDLPGVQPRGARVDDDRVGPADDRAGDGLQPVRRHLDVVTGA